MRKLYKNLVYGFLAAALTLGSGYVIKKKFPSVSYDQHIELARKQEISNDLESAVDEYTEAIKQEPTNPEPYRERGDVRQIENDTEGAIEDYRKALGLTERKAPPVPDKKNLEMIVNIPKKAKIVKRTMNPEGGNNAVSFYESAIQKINNGNLEEALSDLNKALKEDPGFVEAYMKRGILNFMLNDYANSFSDFNVVTSLEPENADGWHNLGVSRFFLYRELYVEGQEIDIARLISIYDVTTAISLDPLNPDFYHTRGNLEHEGGNYYFNNNIEDVNSSWEWADYDYETALYLIKNEEEIDKDIYCMLGRVKKALKDEYGCSKNRNICIHYRRQGETNSFPMDYTCLILEQDSSGKYIRREYDISTNSFINIY